MFELRLIGEEEKLDVIAIRCINCKTETGLFLKNTTFEEIVTKFVLNAILYHVNMLWIISSNEEMKYVFDKSNHQDWLNKCPWYNTDICSRLNVSLFEDFITHTRTDKTLPAYKDDTISIGYRLITKHVTAE